MARRAATLAFAAATLLAPQAHADDVVVAQGRLSDGTCVFDQPVQIPNNYVVRADDTCRLILSPRVPRDGEGPLDLGGSAGTSPDYMAKNMSGDPHRLTGGVTPAGLDTLTAVGSNADWVLTQGGRLVGNAPATAEAIAGEAGNAVAASKYATYLGIARMTVNDEAGRTMYVDVLDMTFQRRVSNGALSPPAPYTAMCDTPGYYDDPTHVPSYIVAGPYDPGVLVCWGEVLATGPDVLAFSSGGTYETWARTPPYGVPSVLYDRRDMRSFFITYDTGFVQDDTSCEMGDSLIPNWQTDCYIREVPWDVQL